MTDMVIVKVRPFNGCWTVWCCEPDGTKHMTMHFTREDAEAQANKLCEEYGYEREQ